MQQVQVYHNELKKNLFIKVTNNLTFKGPNIKKKQKKQKTKNQKKKHFEGVNSSSLYRFYLIFSVC